MVKVVKIGDLVLSKAGRDKGEYFLVVSVEGSYASIVNGKQRKVLNPKKKNIKHLETVLTANKKELAERIQKGQPVGNERVYRVVRSEKQKIQED